jgi:hypothetical protein
MVNWANMLGEQIINVEPVVAEIRMYCNRLLSK